MTQPNQVCLDPDIARAIEAALRANISGNLALDRYHAALAEILSASRQWCSEGDQAIAEEIAAAIREKGIAGALTKACVCKGSVQLLGIVPTLQAHRAISAIARETPGVTEVHDHLICLNPTSGAYMPSCEDSCD
ncbi:hypothetical protein SLG_34740 [Sphingobium sp. SYK-6]|uniref:BON domain-containing protein n=1 Tax=Sphingobium sp. (strain NBRC 103272 / SYK-6) TaxID=627192 RepID=UPI0002277A8A|nr:BON domain-containing protein [Sphingobium sp. SYK-6]BAK68149.1 hypothetical protein SLG_34740 [Sphingobium sp. SYK-6]